MGTYNPDWAIVKEAHGVEKLYLVAETKATLNQLNLRGSEDTSIQCGKVRFSALDIDYRHVISAPMCSNASGVQSRHRTLNRREHDDQR